MKKILLTLCTLVLLCPGVSLVAQVTTPAPSPFCKIEQRVGVTDITIEYSRPGVKGRVVFGDLVPYGHLWRAGANAATKVSFSTDVTVGDAALKAGDYALLITPSPENWTLHFFPYTETDWTFYAGDDAPDAVAVVNAKTMAMASPLETWTIGIGNLRNSTATLDFLWEKTSVSVPITVPTDDLVMASINKTMAGPGAGDYSSAATYYLSEGKDMKQALQWINTGIEKGGERFWLLRTKALIQAKLGDYQGAIASAKRSTELAKESGNDEYPRMNDESIAEWMQK